MSASSPWSERHESVYCLANAAWQDINPQPGPSIIDDEMAGGYNQLHKSWCSPLVELLSSIQKDELLEPSYIRPAMVVVFATEHNRVHYGSFELQVMAHNLCLNRAVWSAIISRVNDILKTTKNALFDTKWWRVFTYATAQLGAIMLKLSRNGVVPRYWDLKTELLTDYESLASLPAQIEKLNERQAQILALITIDEEFLDDKHKKHDAKRQAKLH